MKLPLIVICSTLLLVGCNTQSKKIDALIKQSFNQSPELYEEYTLIENVITEQHNRFEYDEKVSEMLNWLMEAKWGIDHNEQEIIDNANTIRLYNYTGQAIELKKLQDKQDDLLQESYSMCKYWKGLADTIKLRCKHIDTSSFIGWKVKHTYCYKTSEGVFDTAVNYYVIDKNCEKVLYIEKEGNEYDMQRKLIINDIANNDIPPLCTAYNLFYALVSVSFEDYGSLENILMLKESNPDVKREFEKIMERMNVGN